MYTFTTADFILMQIVAAFIFMIYMMSDNE